MRWRPTKRVKGPHLHSLFIPILLYFLSAPETDHSSLNHSRPCTPTPMARLSVVLLLLLSAALAAQATDDEVCSDPGFKPIKLKGGVPATKPVAGIIAQLDKRVRVEAVRNDGCRVTSTKLEKACQKVGGWWVGDSAITVGLPETAHAVGGLSTQPVEGSQHFEACTGSPQCDADGLLPALPAAGGAQGPDPRPRRHQGQRERRPHRCPACGQDQVQGRHAVMLA